MVTTAEIQELLIAAVERIIGAWIENSGGARTPSYLPEYSR
jgi:hypothetical protein